MPLNPRIVGPTRPAASAEFGFVVAIRYKRPDGKDFICSGTLLTTTTVLTAGHCGCGVPGSYWVDPRQDSRSTVRSQGVDVDGAPIMLDQRVCRNGYLGGGNDLALLRLRKAIDLKDAQNKSNKGGRTAEDEGVGFRVGYPTDFVWDLRSILTKGMRLTAVGYGVTSRDTIGVRMQGDIPIYSFDCEEPALAGVCAPFSEMLLAEAPGPAQRTDTCGGDSGGPVFWSRNGIPTLLAVTSRASPGFQDNATLQCGGGGIYTLLGRTSVRQWLTANGVPPAQ